MELSTSTDNTKINNKPVIRSGVYPLMPIAVTANSSQHWPSTSKWWPVSHTTHGPRLYSLVCRTRLTTVQRVIDFSIFDLRGPGPKFTKGEMTYYPLPSYKISAQSRKWSMRYALPFFSTFWRGGLTQVPKFTKKRR